MKFPKLISSLALAASIFSSYAQVSVWPLGHGPTNDYAYAVGSNNTGDLYFVKSQYDESLGFYIDKIMHTQLDRGGNWSEPSMLPAPINDNFNNSVVGLTPNADTLFLLGNYNAANPRLRPGLSYAVKNSNDEWKVGGVINLSGLKPTTEFYGIYVSTKNKVLLASFQTKKSGKDDLYFARQLENTTTYSELIPLPDYINTNESEISPFISEDGKTLTFSRWVGDDKTGSYQIYSCRSRSDDFTKWTEPTPVTTANQASFDAYYWCCLNDYAFFSSDRDSIGKSSIYTFQVIQKTDLNSTSGVQLAGINVNDINAGLADSKRTYTLPATSAMKGKIESKVEAFKFQKLALIGNDGDTLEVADIAEDGTFQFENVPSNGEYKVAMADANSSIDVSETLVSMTSEGGEASEKVSIGEMAKVSTQLMQIDAEKNALAHRAMETPMADKNIGKLEGRIQQNTSDPAKYLHMIDAHGSILSTVIDEKDGHFLFENFASDQMASFELDNASAQENSTVILLDSAGKETESFAFDQFDEIAKTILGVEDKMLLADATSNAKPLSAKAEIAVKQEAKTQSTETTKEIAAIAITENAIAEQKTQAVAAKEEQTASATAGQSTSSAKANTANESPKKEDKIKSKLAESKDAAIATVENPVRSKATSTEVANVPAQKMDLAKTKTKQGIEIYFDRNQSEPTLKSKYQLENLKPVAQHVEEVAAGTDTTGSQDYNLELSAKRVKVISDYLAFSGPAKPQGEIDNMSATLARSATIYFNEQNLVKANGTLFSVVVFHGFDQKTVENTSEINLAYTAYLLKSNSKLKVRVNSFTDNLGQNDYNKVLSQKRADYVQSMLLQFGVNPDQIESAWFGATKSINDCQIKDCNKEERALDRRTELQLFIP